MEENMHEEVIVIGVERTDYSIKQVLSNRNTMSVKDLKQFLERYDDDDETPIVFSHDNGYTYGPLRKFAINTAELNEDGEYEL